MERRDLKADLDWMFNAPSDHAKELEIAVHALERAIEAEKALGNETILNCKSIAGLTKRVKKSEALCQELVDTLEEIRRYKDWLIRDCSEPDKVICMAGGISLKCSQALALIREVLGGEIYPSKV